MGFKDQWAKDGSLIKGAGAINYSLRKKIIYLHRNTRKVIMKEKDKMIKIHKSTEGICLDDFRIGKDFLKHKHH